MKKTQLLTLALACLLLASMGCNNAGQGSTATQDTIPRDTIDTILPGDTIESDPSKFSEPH